MNAWEFDRRFDDGEDLLDHVDWSSARRPNLEPQHVDVDLPRWMVQALDRRADTAGVTREALIRLWIAERLQQASPALAAAE